LTEYEAAVNATTWETLTREAGSHPLLVVLSGPSGVGKDTVLAELRNLDFEFARVVTYTTRKIRDKEIPGFDYNFIDDDEFNALATKRFFVETEINYGQGQYGTPIEPIAHALRSGHDAILRVDVKGSLTIRRKVPDSVLIYLAPPSFDALESRMRGRKSEDEERLQCRLETAKNELASAHLFDYLIVSEEGGALKAATELQAILTAERLRIQSGRPSVEEIISQLAS
jgi:guanylate kinase